MALLGIVVILALAVLHDLNRPLHAAELPANAKLYLPILQVEQKKLAPTMPMPEWQAARTHKETCITAKHPKCWSPFAELKTEREYGFGLGQFTVAYTKTGAVRFNTFEEMKQKDRRLAGWAWEKRFDPVMQIDALLIKDNILYGNVVGAATTLDRIAFTLVGNNGGAASVLYDRRLCQGTRGCDQSRWFGNVELYSGKSRTVMPGYGRSLYEISRDYPRDIINRLMPLYKPYYLGN
jgi:hypothetical protein